MITIIAPAYDNPDKLDIFLDSVEKDKGDNPFFEVIVVDDGSVKSLKNIVVKRKDIRYIRLEEHVGPSCARNIGAKAAKGDYLVFFDSDVVLKPGALKRFEENFKNNVVAVVGEYDIEPINKGFFPRFKALLTESWIPRGGYVSVFALRAAGIKKNIFDNLGGFDENIKTASVEDYEFADRLRAFGVKIVYDPSIVVQHHHPGYLKQLRLFYLRARDWAAIFIKRRGKFDNWCASPSEGLACLSGSFFMLSLFLTFLTRQHIFYTISAAALGGYVVSNYKFISIVHKRQGFLFVPAALLIKLPLVLAIMAGFISGLFEILVYKIMRQK